MLLERIGVHYGLEVDAPSERGIGVPWRALKRRVRPATAPGQRTVGEAGAADDAAAVAPDAAPVKGADPSSTAE